MGFSPSILGHRWAARRPESSLGCGRGLRLASLKIGGRPHRILIDRASPGPKAATTRTPPGAAPSTEAPPSARAARDAKMGGPAPWPDLFLVVVASEGEASGDALLRARHQMSAEAERARAAGVPLVFMTPPPDHFSGADVVAALSSQFGLSGGRLSVVALGQAHRGPELVRRLQSAARAWDMAVDGRFARDLRAQIAHRSS